MPPGRTSTIAPSIATSSSTDAISNGSTYFDSSASPIADAVSSNPPRSAIDQSVSRLRKPIVKATSPARSSAGARRNVSALSRLARGVSMIAKMSRMEIAPA